MHARGRRAHAKNTTANIFASRVERSFMALTLLHPVDLAKSSFGKRGQSFLPVAPCVYASRVTKQSYGKANVVSGA